MLTLAETLMVLQAALLVTAAQALAALARQRNFRWQLAEKAAKAAL